MSFETRLIRNSKVGLDAAEIDVLGIESRHGKMEIVWHADDRARSWLTDN
jgi:hypothetical protein